MLLLPIVDRELRVASRSQRTYIGRVIAGIAALAMALYLVWVSQHALGGVVAGMFILKATTYMAWGLCLFGGANRTADSLSREKRDETLGLLFLTRLKGHDVVLGKLLANGLTAFYLLLGIVPVLSIPVLMGGVAANEMLKIPLALANTLFFSLSVGLFASSVARNQRAATALSGGILVFFAVLLPAAAQLAEREFERPGLARLLKIPSALCTQEMAFNSALGLSTNDYWKSLLVQLTLSLLSLAFACWHLPQSWKTPAGRSAAEQWRAKFQQWTQGSVPFRVQRRSRLLAQNPWYWLSFRDRFAPVWPLLVALTFLGVTAWFIIHYEVPKPPACALLFGAIGLADLVNRTRVASLAATRLAEDRQSGALEMVLSTPLTVRDIVRGQWRAIRKIQLRTYILLFLFYFAVATTFMRAMESTSDGWWIVAGFSLVSAGDFIVLGYVGMWKGMRVANPRQAAGAAMVRVLILPWFLFFGSLVMIEKVSFLRSTFQSAEPYSYIFGALTLWAASSITALWTARRNLALYFREAATDRYSFEERFGLWPRMRQWMRG